VFLIWKGLIMSDRGRVATLCGQPLEGLQHVCAFFDSRDEQYQILNPYSQEGLDSGDRVVTVVESSFHDEHVRRMSAGGISVGGAMESGQFKVLVRSARSEPWATWNGHCRTCPAGTN
jgi:hypothetical protein